MKNFRVLKEDLRQWFDPNHPKGGWKRINSKGEAIGPCAREPGEAKPKCMSNEKRAKLSKKERASAVAAKRRHDPNPERKGGPINVSNFGKGKISENLENLDEKWSQKYKKSIDCSNPKGFSQKAHCQGLKKNEEYQEENMEQLDEKNAPTNPELWSRAKALARSKFDVYPSAYANGWASKWYKSKGGSWRSVSEEVKDKFDVGEYDQEGDMAKSDLRSIMANAQKLHDMIEDADNLPEWCQNKITLAEDYISTVANYLTAEMSESVVQEGRPSQRHPLEGHEYHRKSDEALIHIAKDAHAAAEAMKSHNTAAENKYRDQANDSATVRHFRKTSGMPDWYKKKYGHMKEEDAYDKDDKPSDKPHDKDAAAKRAKIAAVMARKKMAKEEVEQIDELSNDMLGRYKTAAGADASKADKAGDYNKGNKRFSGIMRATKKQLANDIVTRASTVTESNLQEREDDEYHGVRHHNVGVVISKDNGPKERMKATVKAREPQHAVNIALKHYKDKGYTVHDHKYLGESIADDKYGSAASETLVTKPNAEPAKKMKVTEQHAEKGRFNPTIPYKKSSLKVASPRMGKPDEMKEAKDDTPPFDGPYKKYKGTVTDKSGAKHTDMSRAKDLARKAMKKQADSYKAPSRLGEESSRKAEIIKSAAKKKKMDSKEDTFQAEPELSSTITKNY